jgi:hypothetical protein
MFPSARPWATKRWSANHWALLLLALGAALRLLLLGDIPGGLNQDEASIGYDAWALLHGGMDRNGLSWPVNFIAWGSGQNVLYGYLSMPFIALFDLSVFSLRLTSAFWGVVCLWLFWQLGNRRDRTMGILALLVLVTSPWHIMASRWALESNVVPAVVLVAVYLLVRSPEHLSRRLPWACVALTISIYAYGPAYLFAPVFLLCALVLIHLESRISLRTFLISAASAFVVALPMMLFILNNAIGHDHWHLWFITIPHYPSEARYSNIFLPFAQGGWERIPDNTVNVIRMLFGGKDDGLPWNAIPAWGPQYVFLTPFVVIGAILTARRGSSLVDRLMLAWMLCALVTAFCTDANINRINLVWLPSLWLAAVGLHLIAQERSLNYAIQATLLLCCLFFSMQYFTSWSEKITSDFFDGFGPAIKRIVEIAPKDAPIAITGNANMPYISVLFFAKTPVENYVKTAVIPDRKAAFQGVNSFDRFTIGLFGEHIARQHYWVVHKRELSMFNDSSYQIESFGDYAAVSRRPLEKLACTQPLATNMLTGSQDFDTIRLNGEVSGSYTGMMTSGQYFPSGFGVHGKSNWSMPIDQPAQELDIGYGIADNNTCSDGMTFKVIADGKTLFDSGRVLGDTLRFARIPLNNPKQLSFVTEPGQHNHCDHGNWVRPLLISCVQQVTTNGSPR